MRRLVFVAAVLFASLVASLQLTDMTSRDESSAKAADSTENNTVTSSVLDLKEDDHQYRVELTQYDSKFYGSLKRVGERSESKPVGKRDVKEAAPIITYQLIYNRSPFLPCKKLNHSRRDVLSPNNSSSIVPS